VDAGNTCQLNDPCAMEEDDCVDAAICTHTGIGTHTCECPAGLYGDGVKGSTATGCTACPANSQSDAGTAAITGCICDNGYVSGDDQEVTENPSNDGKKCGGTNAAERIFDLRGGSATLAACNTACVSDPSCVAFSAIFGSWCIGCSVPLASAHDGSTAYLKQPPSSGIAALRMLAGDGSTCEKLACPSNSAAVVSDGVGNAQQCACSNGYAGTIAFESSSVESTVESGTNAYSDSCTRTCDGSAVAPEHTDGTISNDSTATKVPDQVSDSTLMFTCSAGYTGMLTYTCGQDGSFTTPDTCTGNICIRSGNSDACPRPTIIPHTLEFRYSYPYIDNVFMRTSLVC
jgi:hypothetical protein